LPNAESAKSARQALIQFFQLFPLWKAIVVHTKNRIRFAINCKSSGFSI
jgi:hypothetical protein